MPYAPIALFTYSRADHTKQAVESLLRNSEAKESELFIFSDGPKNESKVSAVKENRDYIYTITGFKTIHIVEREKNWGLSNSLIAGITDIVNKYGKVIVVEDDLILSRYFLRYMNDALDKYANNEKVSAVSAFQNPTGTDAPETFFLRYFACWGWGTWKRAWDMFNPDVRDLLRQLRWKKNDFNIGGAGPFYSHLYCHKVGLVDTWAARFYASSFLADKLVLFPGHSMAIQSGIDGSGTHSGNNDSHFHGMSLWQQPINIKDIDVEESKLMYRAFHEFYAKGKKNKLRYYYKSFKSFVRRLLGIDYK